MGWLEWTACAITAVVLVGLFAWRRWCERLAAEDAAGLKWHNEAWINHLSHHAAAVKRQMAIEASVLEKAEAESPEAQAGASLQAAVDRWNRDGKVALQQMDGFVRSLIDDAKDLAAQRRMDEVEL